MTISDEKEVYKEFKFFKNIYTKINFSPSIIFEGENGSVKMYFERTSKYSISYGELFGCSQFTKWLKDHSARVQIKTEDLVEIAKCLKKNAKLVEFTDEYFKFEFLTKDETLKTVVLNKLDKTNIIKKVDFDFSFEITNEFFTSEIFEIFFNGVKIIDQKTPEKIFEYPIGKVNSIIKGCNATIHFTKMIDDQRYVEISSGNEDLKLIQRFLTI